MGLSMSCFKKPKRFIKKKIHQCRSTKNQHEIDSLKHSVVSFDSRVTKASDFKSRETSNAHGPFFQDYKSQKLPKITNREIHTSMTSTTASERHKTVKRTIHETIAEEAIKPLKLKEQLKDNDLEPQNLTFETPGETNDYNPERVASDFNFLKKIISVFEHHGAKTSDISMIDFKDVLAGKYFEDTKHIYDLEDQGDEILDLRYDLTVPFARYLAMNRVSDIKRYHIANVFQHGNLSMTEGGCRKFYHCDLDITGKHDDMLPEAECVKIVVEALTNLDIGSFVIKVNHRYLLDGIFAACEVPKDKLRTIFSLIDKLDKSTWEDVRKEMIDDELLDPAIADKIGGYVCKQGNAKLIYELREDKVLMEQPLAMQGLEAIELMLEYCDIYKVTEKIVLDLSLARGYDYYTGIIYEAVLTDSRVGSVAGGGRYDNLVSMVHPKKKNIPCIGVSFSFQRIFSVLDSRIAKKGQKTQAIVATTQENLQKKMTRV